MGSRIGFCTTDSTKQRSPILRQQWKSSIKESVTNMWDLLGGEPDDGRWAIRNDLYNGRAFAALVYAIYHPPFNSIETSTNCDISDNGLITIDVSDYKHWKVYHEEISVKTNQPSDRKQIAEMSVKGFAWSISKEIRERLGEGLD